MSKFIICTVLPRASAREGAESLDWGVVVEYMDRGIELKDLLWKFSVKTFVGPTPTPQSHYRRATAVGGRQRT